MAGDVLNYRAELERRIRQFHRYQEPMDHRAHEEAHGPCYTIFENRHPDGDFGEQAAEERQPALAALTDMFGEGGGFSGSELAKPDVPGLPEEGWRGEYERTRFVQFAFERDWFCMDLPARGSPSTRRWRSCGMAGSSSTCATNRSSPCKGNPRGTTPSAGSTSTERRSRPPRIRPSSSSGYGACPWTPVSTSLQPHSAANTGGSRGPPGDPHTMSYSLRPWDCDRPEMKAEREEGRQ